MTAKSAQLWFSKATVLVILFQFLHDSLCIWYG